MKSSLLAGLGALLLAFSGPAEAQSDPDRRFHAGVDVGQARLNRDWPSYYFGPRRDRESASWKLRFGYSFSRYLALETAYTDFGDYQGSGMVILLPEAPADPPMIFAPGDYRTSAKGIELSAVATWPLGEALYLNATAGILRREFKSRHEPSMPGQPGYRAKDGDLAAQLGLGFGFRINAAVDLGVNWVGSSHLDGDTEFLENSADPSLLSLGLRFRF